MRVPGIARIDTHKEYCTLQHRVASTDAEGRCKLSACFLSPGDGGGTRLLFSFGWHSSSGRRLPEKQRRVLSHCLSVTRSSRACASRKGHADNRSSGGFSSSTGKRLPVLLVLQKAVFLCVFPDAPERVLGPPPSPSHPWGPLPTSWSRTLAGEIAMSVSIQDCG